MPLGHDMAEILAFPARRAIEPPPAVPTASREIQTAVAQLALLADVADLTALAVVVLDSEGREVTHRVGDSARLAEALARLHRDALRAAP